VIKTVVLGPISITAARCVAWRAIASDSQRIKVKALWRAGYRWLSLSTQRNAQRNGNRP